MKSVSRFIAMVLHPMMLPLYGTWLLFNSGSYLSFIVTPEVQRLIYILFFVTTYALPALVVLLMYRSGIVHDLEMDDRRDRIFPFLATLACYGICWYMMIRLPIPVVFRLLLLGGGICIAAATGISLFWKISIHTMGLGALSGILYSFILWMNFDLVIPLSVSVVAAGVAGMARMITGSHTPAQIYAGFLAGFAVEMVFVGMIV